VARDLYHAAVRHALEKDGWIITADPYKMRYGGVNYEVDLSAENVLAADRGTEKIAIEIKSFVQESVPHAFHAAVGQFMNYKLIMRKIEPERRIYLAIRKDVFEDFFQLPFTQEAVHAHGIDLLIFEPASEKVVLWKNSNDTEY
jgi:XisH protein